MTFENLPGSLAEPAQAARASKVAVSAMEELTTSGLVRLACEYEGAGSANWGESTS